MKEILITVLVFAVLGGALGMLLAFASRLFEVKTDPRVPKILDCLPGANCGGCGYSGCAALAEAIATGDAKPSACTVGGGETAVKIGAVMGVEVGSVEKKRAQVMCSGNCDASRKKYIYSGAPDCVSAASMAGGDKMCANGCIGLGTCVAACPFGAISVQDGVAAVDYHKCEGCGVCVAACPKHIIELIPFEADFWVGCKSVEPAATVKKQCDAGCVGCKMCEKVCPSGAVSVKDYVASIDYDKCTECGLCAEKCPRGVIRSSHK